MVEFTLSLTPEEAGQGWLRTNLGRDEVRRDAIIRETEQDAPMLHRDWHDLPMAPDGDHGFRIRIPLLEVGRFAAKAFFLPDGAKEPRWQEGGNVIVKVEPAEACCANTIYTAFARQFRRGGDETADEDTERSMARLERSGHTVIPRSGTFRNLALEMDFIIGTLGFRIIQLLPIHPVPTTYARMGRFGSPFAVLDFMDVDPALAEFDRHTTPLDQFRELVDAVHARSARLFIDIPINHTGWASWLQIHHPEWFARREDRSFRSPGAWGVTWEDLSELDYRHRGLWTYMADVFLYWCRQGVDGFRCDAGYMVPARVWRYLVAKVRHEYPDTVFLLEGLGGKLETVEHLLSDANLDWAYSELFQNYTRREIEAYLPGCTAVSVNKGVLVHFAETHDNPRLASRSPAYARMRTALAALFSDSGAFGITNGVEWYATEKIDVHGATPLNWDREPNQVSFIARLNALLHTHPAFRAGAGTQLIQQRQDNVLALKRTSPVESADLLVLVNLEPDTAQYAAWDVRDFEVRNGTIDILAGREVAVEQHDGQQGLSLAPGQAMCLGAEPRHVERLEQALLDMTHEPDLSHAQRLQATALEICAGWPSDEDHEDGRVEALGQALARDPVGFCHHTDHNGPFRVVSWHWPQDTRRIVMLPPGGRLMVQAEHPFRARLCDGSRTRFQGHALHSEQGTYFAVIPPQPTPDPAQTYGLDITVFEPDGVQHGSAQILVLPEPNRIRLPVRYGIHAILEQNVYAVCTNTAGALAQVRGAWDLIRSQYDAFLAANPGIDHPQDRHIMLTRCRSWLVFRGYSQEIGSDCLDAFTVIDARTVQWDFSVPAGQGRLIRLNIQLQLDNSGNGVTLSFGRRCMSDRDALSDDEGVTIIVRPDIEDRNAHHKTKAFTGPEQAWPGAVAPSDDGFVFSPSSGWHLSMHNPGGRYVPEPEWQYMVHHEEEAERGLDDSSDLFSPGYFRFELAGGEERSIRADVDRLEAGTRESSPAATAGEPAKAARPLGEALHNALQQFIVRRGEAHTVIAGYPWFLDWGRDTLICLRGMITADMHSVTRNILMEFARFEDRGTLPNMLHGRDTSDRDTSDAPLWFLTACSDLMHAVGDRSLLDQDCGGRTLRDVVLSVGRHIVSGTPNGIHVDVDSGLVFSPSHFTWMDTNHPAGTPREGYPIEIQALWYAGLRLLHAIDPEGGWDRRMESVQASLHTLFRRPSRTPGSSSSGLADCLHGSPGTHAAQAAADDAVRPNQLLAVTLGALDDRALCADVLAACEPLLVPGGLRSLADAPVTYPLPVHADDRLLNDPHSPYWGRYQGDEDTRRKPAYHNGTAWTWLLPSYCEALFLTYGDAARSTAAALLGSVATTMDRDCVLQVPEILDGDAPHRSKGCGAQAWGVSEAYRVHRMLSAD